MSRKMIDYKVEDGKIVSIDGYEVGGGGGYEIKKITITENGLYDSEFEAYKPIIVDVPQISENGTLLKNLLNATKSTNYLFSNYTGTSVDGLISYIDTTNVTHMDYMFVGCKKLTSIPLLNTSKVITMVVMFRDCNKITSIPQLDVSNVTDMSYMFDNCTKLEEIHMTGMKTSFDISVSTLFTREALVEILNNLATVTSTKSLRMGATNLAKLTDEDKQIATNKGWTLA